MNTDHLDSAEFRAHIRNLLYEYSITHYTTNYVTFTEDVVSEFLESLKPVPLTDPYSFSLSVDPFQSLSKIYSLDSLKPYDEIPQTTHEACLYLKNFISTTLGPPKSKKLTWSEDNYKLPPEPFLPALTRRARQQTPKLGKQAKQAEFDTHQKLLKSMSLIAIPVEPVEEEKIIIEDVLQLKLIIDAEELPAVKAALQKAVDMIRPQKGFKNKSLDSVLLCTEPTFTYEPPEEVFMPIFPRARNPRSGAGSGIGFVKGLNSYADIPSMVTKVDVQDPDSDISRANLVIVDGWETIRSSPPSTPLARNSDDEEEIDQLFPPSSPDTEPALAEEIEKAKMEEILIPRSKQIGGSSGITPHILCGKTLQSFLQPLLSQKKTQSEIIPEIDKTLVDNFKQLPSSPTPSSLLGQPPSELPDKDAHGKGALNECFQGRDLDTDLRKLYGGHAMDNLIMNETIDDKQSMMWEVPELPGPNVHPPNDMHVPRAFSDFVVPPTSNKNKINKTQHGSVHINVNSHSARPHHQFLKKARGRQSLGLALSWIPFTVDKRLPSLEELVGASELFDDQRQKPLDFTSFAQGAAGSDPVPISVQVDELLKTVDPDLDSIHPNPNNTEVSRTHSWTENTTDTLYHPPDVFEDFRIILNRQERRRIAKLENRLEEESGGSDPGVDDVGVDTGETAPTTEVDTSSKQQEAGETSYERDDDDRYDDRRPLKRPRLDDGYRGFDDVAKEKLDCSRPPRTMMHLDDPSSFCGQNQVQDLDAYGPGSQVSNTQSPSADENKENWPPVSSSFMSEVDEADNDRRHNSPAGVGYDEDYPMRQEPSYDHHMIDYCDNMEVDVNEVMGFEPLSFGSQYPASSVIKPPEIQNRIALAPVRVEIEPDDYSMKLSTSHTNADADTNIGREDDNVVLRKTTHLAHEPDIASHALGIFTFAQLRSRKISQPKPMPEVEPAPAPTLLPVTGPEEGPQGAPKDLYDQSTIVLSEIALKPPVVIHRYMASLDFIQKHALIRYLRAEECAVDLVERQTLGGVDLIVDPYCAVIFISLFTLPANYEAYVERVSQQSWRYENLLVVLEGYQVHRSMKSNSHKPVTGTSKAGLEPYAYTTPIVKAIKKFRRDVNVAGGCGTKRAGTVVQYVFADSVREAALVTRWYGDRAEERDQTDGEIWGKREWLDVDFEEDEENCMAGINGLNHFLASIILYRMSLQDFLELGPEGRVGVYAGFIADDALVECNMDIERRLQSVETSSGTGQ